MSYHDYRERKAKGLVKLNKKTITHSVTVGEENQENVEISFSLESKRFNERDGSELPYPEVSEVNVENFQKEKARLQGLIEDIDEVLADIEAQE